MVDTTTTKASISKPLDDSKAGAPEIEVTPAMIDAGALAADLAEFVVWLRSSHQIYLCSPGAPGEMVEDGRPIASLIGKFLEKKHEIH